MTEYKNRENYQQSRSPVNLLESEKKNPTLIPSYLNVLPPSLEPKMVKHKRPRKKIEDVLTMPQIDEETALICVSFESDQ